MENITIFTLAVELILALNQAAPVTESDGIRCTSQEECPDGMCCVHNPLGDSDNLNYHYHYNSSDMRRRRFMFENYAQHDHGFCRNPRRINESCWPEGHDPKNPKLYDYFCPCESGLDCRGLIVHETAHSVVERYPKCQTPESNIFLPGHTASGQTCQFDSDCGSGMCCVTYPKDSVRSQVTRPFLRRQTTITHGYCRREKLLHESCDMSHMIPHDFRCSCASGLVCRGTTIQDIGDQLVHINPVCQKPASG